MKKTIFIIILIMIILGLGGYLVYDKFLTKEEKKPDTVKEVKRTDDTVVEESKSYVTEAYNKIISWNFPEELQPDSYEKNMAIVQQVVLPKININTANAKKFNDKIMNDYKDIVDIVNKGDYSSESPLNLRVTSTKVNYDYMVIDNIIFIIINDQTVNHRGSGSLVHKGYYYDINEDKELTYSDIYNKYGITLDDVNKDIDQENIHRGATDPSNAGYLEKVRDYDQVIMPFLSNKTFKIYVDTSFEKYETYIDRK